MPLPWIKVSPLTLPPEGKYVIGRHTRGTWHDSTDQENVNCVVVKLVKGISMEERKQMAKDGFFSTNRSLRWEQIHPEDEHGNNKVPYYWKQFGPDSFFGQEISHWMAIEPLQPDIPNNAISVGDRLYREANPHGRMDTPSFVYEQVERAARRWVQAQSPLSLYEWCKMEQSKSNLP